MGCLGCIDCYTLMCGGDCCGYTCAKLLREHPNQSAWPIPCDDLHGIDLECKRMKQ